MEKSPVAGIMLAVDDPSRVAECRRMAARISAIESLSEEQAAKAALVCSELATNLSKYAQRGVLQISPLSPRGRKGIEFLSIDYGPGMNSVENAMRDGESTSGSSGTGLGAVRRLSNDFDIYSQRDRGTAVVSQIFQDPSQPRPPFLLGVTTRPVAGEDACGDAWGMRMEDGSVLLVVVDGLGHGLLAADASLAAVAAFQQSRAGSPAELVDVMHRALRGTRGAALAVARIELAGNSLRFAGLGNIVGSAVTGSRSQGMVSHNGTAGHEAMNIKEFTYVWTSKTTVVMHSDGLSANWNLESYPGLFERHESLISGILYRDAGRDRDDACVVAGKCR